MTDYHGGCLCDAVRFTYHFSDATKPLYCGFCHCNVCRGLMSSPASHQAGVPVSALSYTGEDNIKVFTVNDGKAERGSCKKCGTHLFLGGVGAPFRNVFPATFDWAKEQFPVCPEPFRPTAHVNCENSFVYSTFANDGLPHFKDLPEMVGGTGKFMEAPSDPTSLREATTRLRESTAVLHRERDLVEKLRLSHDAKHKILCVLTSVTQYPDGRPTGWYAPELIHPYNVFVHDGHEVVIASITGTAQCDPSSQLDSECEAFLNDEALKRLTVHTPELALLNAEDFDAVLFVGGFGVMWDFPSSASAHELIRAMYESGKPVAAVCHGPIVFANVTLSDGTALVAGKEVTAFTNAEEDAVGAYAVVSPPSGPGSCEDVLSARGGIFKQAGTFEANVTVAGNLICGQNPPSAALIGHTILKKVNESKKDRLSRATAHLRSLAKKVREETAALKEMVGNMRQ